MRQYAWAAVAAALTVAGCATGTATGPDAPPYGALVSPAAAMELVFNEVCLPAIIDNQSIETLALRRFMRPVSVRETGSAQAVAAWRLASYSEVYVMQLPNGGCSASVEAGDADGLNARALELLALRGSFTAGLTAEMRGGNAVNTAHCSPELDRTVVVGLIRKTGGRGPAFLANVFRAQGARPPFCPPSLQGR